MWKIYLGSQFNLCPRCEHTVSVILAPSWWGMIFAHAFVTVRQTKSTTAACNNGVDLSHLGKPCRIILQCQKYEHFIVLQWHLCSSSSLILLHSHFVHLQCLSHMWILQILDFTKKTCNLFCLTWVYKEQFTGIIAQFSSITFQLLCN